MNIPITPVSWFIKPTIKPTVSQPPFDLDPTTNHALRDSLWQQLLASIEKQMNNKEEIYNISKDRIDTCTKRISKERSFGKNVRHLLKLVSRAFLNPVYIPWDVEEFYLQHVQRGRDKKRIKFPSPEFGAFSEPLTVVDKKGRIVLWYLPGLLSSHLQSGVREATLTIGPALKKSIQKRKSDQSWRTKKTNFVAKNSSHEFEPGAVNLSAGWFPLGHERKEDILLASRNIRKESHLGYLDWIRKSNEVEGFLNLTLSLIYPDLFKCGLHMLQKLRTLETTNEIAQEWQSVYTGISIISNRTTPSHRDSRGRPQWFDTLMSYSDAETTPRLLINDLGLDLEYPSGTVVSFCGTVLKHEVRSWGDGDRVCYAHFMREAVRKRLDVPPARWLHRNIYLPESMNGDNAMDLGD